MSTLVYDGDCGFCTTCVSFVDRRLHVGVTAIAWQHADLAALGLTVARARDTVQWVDDGGVVSSGHVAIGRLLVDAGGWWRLVGRLVLVPPLSWIAAGVYRLVADNRHRLPGGTPACALPPGSRR